MTFSRARVELGKCRTSAVLFGRMTGEGAGPTLFADPTPFLRITPSGFRLGAPRLDSPAGMIPPWNCVNIRSPLWILGLIADRADRGSPMKRRIVLLILLLLLLAIAAVWFWRSRPEPRQPDVYYYF